MFQYAPCPQSKAETHCKSEFRVGSPWKLVNDSGEVWDSGEIVEPEPPHRLVIR